MNILASLIIRLDSSKKGKGDKMMTFGLEEGR